MQLLSTMSSLLSRMFFFCKYSLTSYTPCLTYLLIFAGYFMYDFLDVLFNNWKNSKGVLFHHVVVRHTELHNSMIHYPNY